MRDIINEVMLMVSASLAASTVAKVTFTTALALVGTRLARRNSASVRHLLLAASFALLLGLPVASLLAPSIQITMPVAAQETAASLPAETIATTAHATTRGNVAAVPTPEASQSWKLSPSMLFLAAWLLGAVLFLLPVASGLWQTRSLRRSGRPWRYGQLVADRLAVDAGIQRRIEVLLHESVPGPVICGVIHPAIMLPSDAQAWPDDELSRALVHELEHARRSDWISRCLARALCACYWFHPLVWATWRQFVLESERACDDAVLQLAEAADYADQLVLLAQRLTTAPKSPLLAMANRHDLARRIAALLDNRQRRGRAGASWVGIVCVVSVVLVAAISPLHIVARAQTPGTQPQIAADNQRFEVASVKACKVEDFTVPGQRRPEFTVSPGRVTLNCLTLERIIYFAYAGIGSLSHPLLNDSPANPDHIRGGPGWIRSDTFVVEAKAAGTPDRTVMMGPMLRALLDERFHLQTHRETETVPMYALTVAKSGLKIQPVEEGGCTSPDAAQALSQEARLALSQGPKPVCGGFTSLGNGVNGEWTLGGESLTKFANQTLSGVLDRYVMDKTAVSGLFNIHLQFGFDDNINPGVFGGRPSLSYSAENPPPSGIERGPSIFSALEEQLGLKLEKTNGPREFLVIDHVERPSDGGRKR